MRLFSPSAPARVPVPDASAGGILVDSLLDTYMANRYNEIRAEVAQSVEQRTENPRVPSSNLGLGTILRRETGSR
jgi:hypothetical protein